MSYCQRCGGYQYPYSYVGDVVGRACHCGFVAFQYQPTPQQGWQCPVCKRVMAPDVPMCLNNHEDKK